MRESKLGIFAQIYLLVQKSKQEKKMKESAA